MRFLFGDSAPFPAQYDFLVALEAFVENAARAVKLDAEVRELRDASRVAVQTRAHAVEALQSFHDATLRTLEPTVIADREALSLEYARHVSDSASHVLEDIKRTAAQTTATEQARMQGEIDRRHGEIRTALAAFLTRVRLPVTQSTVSMRLQDGRNELSAVLTSLGVLTTTFMLTVKESPAWHAPRRVGDFAKGVELPVGVKRSWFSKDVANEMTSIDDYIVGAMALSDDDAKITLRKKVTDKDSVVLDVRRIEGVLSAELHHIGEAGTDASPTALDDAAIAHVERLWDAMRSGVSDVLGHRERLLAVAMDGGDVCEKNLVTALIEKIVAQIAPTVSEIARRSPNALELSLKAESEQGRREEIYVKKADLAAKLEPLGASERKLFAPFALLAAIEKNGGGPSGPTSQAGQASLIDKVEKKPTGRESVPDEGAWETTH